jgi:hypothetical protein
VGVKQRVVVITPPKRSDELLNPMGDAISMISKFDLRSTEEDGWNPIVIESTLLSGAAVAGLSLEEKKRAFGAIAGISAGDFTPTMVMLSVLYDSIGSMKPDFTGNEEEGKAFEGKRKEILNNLNASAKRILSKSPETYVKYKWDQKAKHLFREAEFGTVKEGAPRFRALTYYRSGLKLSVESLRRFTKNFDVQGFDFDIDGVRKVPDMPTKLEYLGFLKDQEKLLADLDAEIRKEPAIRDAIEFSRNLFVAD